MQINAGGRKKNTKCRKKTQNFSMPSRPSLPLAHTNMSSSVSTSHSQCWTHTQNNNYCLVSHYSLSLGSNVINVCFTGFLPSLCFGSIIMLSLLRLLLAAGLLHGLLSLLPCPDTRCRQDARSGISPAWQPLLPADYCGHTYMHTASLWVSAPGRVVRSGA